jgi:hypothetical protein
MRLFAFSCSAQKLRGIILYIHTETDRDTRDKRDRKYLYMRDFPPFDMSLSTTKKAHACLKKKKTHAALVVQIKIYHDLVHVMSKN